MYRRVLTFLVARFTRGEELGLSLTLSLALIFFGVWGFGEVAENVIERNELARHDDPVANWVEAHRTGWLTTAMHIATDFGGLSVAVPIVVIAAVLLPGPWGRWRTVVLMVGVMGGTSLLVNSIKLAIARPRPTLTEVVATASGYAFPSGHAAQALAAYGTLAYLVTLRWRGRGVRVLAWTGAAAIAGVVGFSRLYLGVHWLTDVLGGFLVGAVWSMALLATVTTVAHLRTRLGKSGP